MDSLKTASGKTFRCDLFAPLPEMGIVYLRVSGGTLAEIADVFSNPNETIRLWYGREYLAQYTKLDSLVPEADTVRVCLRKE